jgi:hypothetical protein
MDRHRIRRAYSGSIAEDLRDRADLTVQEMEQLEQDDWVKELAVAEQLLTKLTREVDSADDVPQRAFTGLDEAERNVREVLTEYLQHRQQQLADTDTDTAQNDG